MTTQISTSSDCICDIIIEADNKITCAGYSYPNNKGNFTLVRYNSNGTLDSGFGTDGIAKLEFGTAASVIRQPDGKYIAGGKTYNNSYWKFALARFNSNGSLDYSFGNLGKVITQIGTSIDWIHSLILQPDGLILAGGETSTEGTYPTIDFALARYTSGLTISIPELNEPDNFLIYPNPSGDRLYLNDTGTEKLFFAIYNIEGKQIHSREITSGSIDISDLSKGIYIINIYCKGKNFTTRFLKE